MQPLDAVIRRNTLVLTACLVPYALTWQLLITVAPLTAQRLTGDPAFAGLAISVTVLGSALTPVPAGRFMDRRGRRLGLSLGFVTAAAGVLVALLAVTAASAPLFYLGLFAFGAGGGAIFLARAAATDMYPPERRASAVGRLLVGIAAGALLGVLVFTPMLRGVSDLATVTAPWLIAAALLGVGALVVWLAPVDPLDIARQLHLRAGAPPAYDRRGMRVIFTQPALGFAVLAAAAASLTMSGSMPTMGLELQDRGHDLADISIALGAHYVGMYALSPLGGIVVDRLGGQRALVVGLGVLATAVVGILATPLAVVAPAMFFVGVGWNIAFLGATTLVANGTRAEERALALGGMDLVTVTAGALGSALATPILAAYGVGTIVALAVSLSLAPAAVILARGRAAVGAPA